MVGVDVVLKDMFYTLKAMKPSSGQAASAGIYLHQAYNIKHYETMENFRKENAWAKFSFIGQGLNENHSMPRLIIMMLITNLSTCYIIKILVSVWL